MTRIIIRPPSTLQNGSVDHVLAADPPHEFHIPVLGTGFTIDTPLKVARFGISSVLSLVDDVLIEQMRQFHAGRAGEPYEPIRAGDEDPRARRITAYLNLLQRLIDRQMDSLRAAPFEAHSELDQYFEMLPEGPRKRMYRQMLHTSDPAERAERQAALRASVVPGAIDVNIMTKIDRERYTDGRPGPLGTSDALSALRGFALSDLSSSVVFSAGLNLRLYSYAAQFPDFLPDNKGRLKKTIILKVSDYRSAEIQGRTLAKRGLWVSEFRIESGLNCGGHAFPTDGELMGPILEQFRLNRQALSEELYALCNAALLSHGRPPFLAKPTQRLTVQGGIGTAEEHSALRRMGADATGWGTPFLLVPEAVNLDEDHRQKLTRATAADISLSDHSPLGVPFWTLNTSSSERAREALIDSGNPGSLCPKRYLALRSEFTEVPLCAASHDYQSRKIDQIDQGPGSDREKREARDEVMHKACICHDLAGGVLISNNILKTAKTAVCPGPNIVYFHKVSTLREMVDHIYGRFSVMDAPDRPHVFINELKLYVDYFRQECERGAPQLTARAQKHLEQFKANLLSGIALYRERATQITAASDRFLRDLQDLQQTLESLSPHALAV